MVLRGCSPTLRPAVVAIGSVPSLPFLKIVLAAANTPWTTPSTGRLFAITAPASKLPAPPARHWSSLNHSLHNSFTSFAKSTMRPDERHRQSAPRAAGFRDAPGDLGTDGPAQGNGRPTPAVLSGADPPPSLPIRTRISHT